MTEPQLTVDNYTSVQNMQISELLLILNFVSSYKTRYNLCKIEEIN